MQATFRNAMSFEFGPSVVSFMATMHMPLSNLRFPMRFEPKALFIDTGEKSGKGPKTGQNGKKRPFAAYLGLIFLTATLYCVTTWLSFL